MKKKAKPKRKKLIKKREGLYSLSKEEVNALLHAARGPKDEALADYHAADNDYD